MSDLPFSMMRLKLFNYHKWAGITILLSRGAAPALAPGEDRPPADLPAPKWQHAAAHVTHWRAVRAVLRRAAGGLGLQLGRGLPASSCSACCRCPTSCRKDHVLAETLKAFARRPGMAADLAGRAARGRCRQARGHRPRRPAASHAQCPAAPDSSLPTTKRNHHEQTIRTASRPRRASSPSPASPSRRPRSFPRRKTRSVRRSRRWACPSKASLASGRPTSLSIRSSPTPARSPSRSPPAAPDGAPETTPKCPSPSGSTSPSSRARPSRRPRSRPRARATSTSPASSRSRARPRTSSCRSRWRRPATATTATGTFTIKRNDFKIGEGEWTDTSAAG